MLSPISAMIPRVHDAKATGKWSWQLQCTLSPLGNLTACRTAHGAVPNLNRSRSSSATGLLTKW